MIEFWTLLIAVVTAAACALTGTFLVLKREALVSEGLAHSVLPGIVIAYVITGSRTSPLLIAGAAGMGLAMVLLVQAIRRTGIVDRDASLGVVFPALFSIGVLLANAELSGVHFHADCIIDGNLSLSVLDRVNAFGRDLGPKALWTMSIALLSVAAFLALFYKEMKLVTFDAGLAGTLGFRPALMNTVWLALVSFVTVAAFETAGSILVVALMIAPPAAASLWTKNLPVLLAVAVLFAIAAAISGFYTAFALDIAPAGPMATLAGVVFLVSFLVAPSEGVVSARLRRRSQSRSLEASLLAARAESSGPAPAETLRAELDWPTSRFERALAEAVSSGLVSEEGGAGSTGPRTLRCAGPVTS